MKRIVILITLLALPVILLAGAWYNGKNTLSSRMQTTLASYGFTRTGTPMPPPQIGDGRTMFENLQLDNGGFSTIERITYDVGLKDLLLQKTPQTMQIDGLNLAAEFDKNSGLDVAGWSKTALPYPAAQLIILKSGQLDLYNEQAGALRFQAKGEMEKQADNSFKLKVALWGVQHQLKMQTVWDGHIYPDGTWSYDIDVQDGGLKFDKIQAARISGWISINKSKSPIPQISGQLAAGQMNIGGLSFRNFKITLDGPFDSYKLITKARIADFQNMTATLDILGNPVEGPQISATVETQSIDDLVAFLVKLQDSALAADSMTSLLLTKGNLQRLKEQVAALDYDSLEFQITGSVYDLTGKIVVKKFMDGTLQRDIISLEPAENEG